MTVREHLALLASVVERNPALLDSVIEVCDGEGCYPFGLSIEGGERLLLDTTAEEGSVNEL